MKTVTDNDDIILITSDGVIIRMHTDEISSYSRQTQGVRVMRLDDGVSVMSIARTEREEETDEEAENSEEVIADDTTETQIADERVIMKKSISVIAIILSMVMVLASCGTTQNGKDEEPVSTPDPELVKNTVNATIELEDGDEIMLELYPDLAPDTVENFVELAEDGFYDGTIFHRVIEDFMIQGGGYDENLKEQKTESIKGEFAKNGFENTLSHTRGVISMARAQDYDSATSQFFIVQKDATYLDGQYAAFGRVTEGMDIVDEIASVKTGTVASSNMEDVPIEPIVIDTITIDTSVSSGKSSKTKATSKPSKDKDTDKNSKDTDDEDEDTSSSKSSKSSSKSTTAPKSTPKSNSSSKSSSSNSSSSSKSNSSNDDKNNDDELSEDELNDFLPFLQSDSTESNS